MEIFNFKIIDTSGDLEKDLEFDEYLIGIIESSLDPNKEYEYEYIKAHTVISRTYVLHNLHLLLNSEPNKKIFTTSEIGLHFFEVDTMNKEKIQNAIKDTAGEVIVYDGDIIMPVFFNTGSGFTRNAKEAWGVDLPYLVSTTSKQDISSFDHIKVFEYEHQELLDKLTSYFPDLKLQNKILFDEIKIMERDSIGYVTKVSILNKTIAGEEFAHLLGLNSNNFYMETDDEYIRFICTGIGHGVGLSTYGANIMAKEGLTYQEILNHYYHDIKVELLKDTN